MDVNNVPHVLAPETKANLQLKLPDRRDGLTRGRKANTEDSCGSVPQACRRKGIGRSRCPSHSSRATSGELQCTGVSSRAALALRYQL